MRGFMKKLALVGMLAVVGINLGGCNDDVKKKNSLLTEENTRLRTENDNLGSQNQQLQSQYTQLQGELANRSMNQVWKRSMLTGISTLIMLSSLFLLGSASIKWFILTLIMGIVLGTYSSIFVATPLLVYWNKRQQHH